MCSRVKILQLTIPLNELPVLSSKHSYNAQSIPLNIPSDTVPVQVHFKSAPQTPLFRQGLSPALHSNVGHDPATNATPPGQGVGEVVGLPLNTYNNY